MKFARKSSQPKYAAVVEELRHQIRHEYRAGDQLPTLVELRARYDASNSTMERVYSMLEDDGLIVREQGRGTFVTEPKARVASGLIGFVGVDFLRRDNSTYVAHLLEGVRSASTRSGTQIVLLDAKTDQGLEKVDGVLIYSPRLSEPILRRLPPQLPCVSLLAVRAGAASVVADDRGGARQAVEFLIALGHRRIACLMEEDAPLPALRIQGYRDAVEAASLAPQERRLRPFNPHLTGDYRRLGYDAMRDWLQGDWHQRACTALLAQNDSIAAGAMRALQEAGLRVPHDVSVIGFDGTEDCDHLSPRLASVAVPLYEIGRTGSEMLLRHIETECAGAPVTTLATQLRPGESVAPPPTEKIT